jgi:Mg2+ and Co2+ transporter CorA
MLMQDQQEHGLIPFSQFCRLIRYLWLQQLLSEDWNDQSQNDYAFDYIDYSGSYYKQGRVPGWVNEESRSFFSAPRHSSAKMRWIHVPNDPASVMIILRLSVKYRFHPTSIEDVIELEDQPPKVNAFEYSLLDLGRFSMDSLFCLQQPDKDEEKKTADILEDQGLHYFISIPMFELTQRSLEKFESSDRNQNPKRGDKNTNLLAIEIKEATLGIFVASLPTPDLVVTVSTKWSPTRVKPFQAKSDSDETLQQQFIDNTQNTSLDSVVHLLQKRYSIQRQGNSDWLMYALIDAVVDNLRPISNIYELQLKLISSHLVEREHRLDTDEVKSMIIMKRDLDWLQHELRPMLRVLRHLISDEKLGIECSHYLEDIEDHLQQVIDELASYAQECEALKAEYTSYLDRRMNDVLYLLTLVTTVVVPAQFFTGYYGMNFVDNDTGESGLPLLNLGWQGLVAFWGITVFCTGAVLLLMYYYKWFEMPQVPFNFFFWRH